MARSRKEMVVKVPQPIFDFMESNLNFIAKGATIFLSKIGQNSAENSASGLSLPDQVSVGNVLAKVLYSMSGDGNSIPPELSQAIGSALTTYKTLVSVSTSTAKWPVIWVKSRQPLDALVSLPDFLRVVGNDPFFESKTARYSFALFIVAYYLLALGKGEVPTLGASTRVEQERYWILSDDEPYTPLFYDHLVVRVRNIVPLGDPEQLASLSDPFSAYHDIVFTSALLAGIHTGHLKLHADAIEFISKQLPITPPPPNSDFADAFYHYQKVLVDSYDVFSKRISIVSQYLSHVVSVVFAVDPISARRDFGKWASFTDTRLTFKTLWIHTSFVTLIPADKYEYVFGTHRARDTALFRDYSGSSAPLVYVSKPYLRKRLADIRATQTDYLILVRPILKMAKKPSKGDTQDTVVIDGVEVPKPIPVRVEYELLSLVPLTADVVVRRTVETTHTSVLDVRDAFGLDTPSSYRDVLDSLYLLARAYSPDFAVLYDGGVLGRDQYLALLTSMLGYLSPTMSLVSYPRKYDPRIHALLYGIKGTGKTLLMESYYEHWSDASVVFIDATRKHTEAGLIGGVQQFNLGAGKVYRAYVPGALLKGDGGMIAVDEFDSALANPTFANALATIMESGIISARHISADNAPVELRDHASIVAAANPLRSHTGGGKYVEEMFAAMFLLNDEMREFYKRFAPALITEIEKKLFAKGGSGTLDMSAKLHEDLQYLASDTPSTFIFHHFYKTNAHKYIDRVSFIIPMYTITPQFAITQPHILKSGYFDNKIVIYDPLVADGKIEIPRRAMKDFTQHIHMVSPFIDMSSDDPLDNLRKLYADSISLGQAWFKESDHKFAQKATASGDTDETVRLVMRAIGPRDHRVFYRLAHTLLKIFGETELKKPYRQAIIELIRLRDSLLYESPLGHTRPTLPLKQALYTALRAILDAGHVRVGNETYYFVIPDSVEAAYVDIVRNYRVTVPEKGGITFNVVDLFEKVIYGVIDALQRAGYVLKKVHPATGEQLPAVVLQDEKNIDELLAKVKFEITNRGTLYVNVGNLRIKIGSVV